MWTPKSFAEQHSTETTDVIVLSHSFEVLIVFVFIIILRLTYDPALTLTGGLSFLSTHWYDAEFIVDPITIGQAAAEAAAPFQSKALPPPSFTVAMRFFPQILCFCLPNMASATVTPPWSPLSRPHWYKSAVPHAGV